MYICFCCLRIHLFWSGVLVCKNQEAKLLFFEKFWINISEFSLLLLTKSSTCGFVFKMNILRTKTNIWSPYKFLTSDSCSIDIDFHNLFMFCSHSNVLQNFFLYILYVKIKLLPFLVSIFDILNNFRDVYTTLYTGMSL